MPQVVHLRSEEAALLELEGDVGTPQQAQDGIQVPCMFRVRTREHDYVIEIDEAYLLADSGEDYV